MTEITIALMFEDQADRNLPLPVYETHGSAGADLRANFSPEKRAGGLTLLPLQRALCPTGIRLEIPFGFEAQIRPRSGLSLKHGITLANSPGTIDSDYRGPLGIILINLGSEPYKVSHGDRIAQMVIAPVVKAGFHIATQLRDTKRSGNGFGSTGSR